MSLARPSKKNSRRRIKSKISRNQPTLAGAKARRRSDFDTITERVERTNGKRWERILATLGQLLLARFWNGRRKQFQKSIQIVKGDRMPADPACLY